jgi:hypothetical protein
MRTQRDRRISARDSTAIVDTTRKVETATTSSALVLEVVTLNGATGGTVRAGGAITGERVCAEGPPLGAADGVDAAAGGDDPRAGGSGDVSGGEVGRGVGTAFGVGRGVGVAVGGVFGQQPPSP